MEELIEKIKSQPLSYRLAGGALIIALLCYYYYDGENQVVSANLEQANSALSASKSKLADANKKKQMLPTMTTKLASVKQELENIKKFLPSAVIMDDVLGATQIAANEAGIKLRSFTPGTIVENKRYDEVPIALTLEGGYVGITRFLDALTHFDNLVHVDDVKLTPIAKIGSNRGETTTSVAALIKRAKDEINLTATVSVVLYRSKINGA